MYSRCKLLYDARSEEGSEICDATRGDEDVAERSFGVCLGALVLQRAFGNVVLCFDLERGSLVMVQRQTGDQCFVAKP